MINLRGELVGINSAIFTPSGGNVGIGFAIPSSIASYVMRQLIEFGEVRRGTLGIYVQDLTQELAGAFGVESGKGALVAEVVDGSAAQGAGIQAGDVITRMSGHPVNNARDFHNLEGQLPLGESLALEFVRDQDVRQVDIAAQAMRKLDGADIDYRLSGATFEELPLQLRSERLTGVLISQLNSDSRMARSGLRPGDVITAVNRQAIQGLTQFEQVVSSISGSIYLLIRRNGGDYRARID